MCKSRDQGGLRCAAHAPRLLAAASAAKRDADRSFDAAFAEQAPPARLERAERAAERADQRLQKHAIEFAATDSGQQSYRNLIAKGEQNGNLDQVTAAQAILERGLRRRSEADRVYAEWKTANAAQRTPTPGCPSCGAPSTDDHECSDAGPVDIDQTDPVAAKPAAHATPPRAPFEAVAEGTVDIDHGRAEVTFAKANDALPAAGRTGDVSENGADTVTFTPVANDAHPPAARQAPGVDAQAADHYAELRAQMKCPMCGQFVAEGGHTCPNGDQVTVVAMNDNGVGGLLQVTTADGTTTSRWYDHDGQEQIGADSAKEDRLAVGQGGEVHVSNPAVAGAARRVLDVAESDLGFTLSGTALTVHDPDAAASAMMGLSEQFGDQALAARSAAQRVASFENAVAARDVAAAITEQQQQAATGTCGKCGQFLGAGGHTCPAETDEADAPSAGPAAAVPAPVAGADAAANEPSSAMPSPAAAASPPVSFADQKGDDRIRAMLTEIESGVDNLGTADGWRQFLAFQGTFHRYSFNNNMLIGMQRPDATIVAGASKWRQHGRYPKKGSKAIWVLAPMTRKVVDRDEKTGEESSRQAVVGFRAVPVFDVAETDGEPLPRDPTTMRELTGAAPDDITDDLTNAAATHGYTVHHRTIAGGAEGYTDPAAKEIVLADRLSERQRVATCPSC